MEINRKLNAKKSHYNVYSYGITEDRYGNETYDYSTEPSNTIFCLMNPISSEVEIAEYGERVNEMLQFCLFDDSIVINEKDRVEVKGNMYTVDSIKPYPSYRLCIIERVR